MNLAAEEIIMLGGIFTLEEEIVINAFLDGQDILFPPDSVWHMFCKGLKHTVARQKAVMSG